MGDQQEQSEKSKLEALRHQLTSLCLNTNKLSVGERFLVENINPPSKASFKGKTMKDIVACLCIPSSAGSDEGDSAEGGSAEGDSAEGADTDTEQAQTSLNNDITWTEGINLSFIDSYFQNLAQNQRKDITIDEIIACYLAVVRLADTDNKLDEIYLDWLNQLEPFLRPQQGWRLGGLLSRTASSLSTRNQFLINMLREDKNYKDKNLVSSCLHYWQQVYGKDVSQGEQAYQELLNQLNKLNEKNKTKLEQQEETQFKALAEIVGDYCKLDKCEGVKPTHFHHIWTGLYYSGEHHDAAYRNVFKRTWHQLLYWAGRTEHLDQANDRRVKRHFMALCERLAIIDPKLLHNLQTKIQEIQDGDKNSQLVERLHYYFDKVSAAYFKDLGDLSATYKNYLKESYVNHQKSGQTKTNVNNLIDNILGGCSFDDAEVEELITKIKRSEYDQLSELLHDCKYYRKQLDSERELINRNLRELKKDINRLAQDLDVSLHIAKKEEQQKQEAAYYLSVYESKKKMSAGVSREKQRHRAIKKRNKTVANVVSVLVGIGEGAVAAIGFFGLVANPAIAIPVALFIGISGFYCNKLLVKKDTYDTLNTLFISGIFKDDSGKEVSFGTKLAVILTGSLSLGTGFCYGTLSAVCLSEKILLPVLNLVFAHKVAIGLAIALSTGPLGATSIGFAALFFVVIADLVKNRAARWQSIKEFFKNALVPDWDLLKARRKRYGLFVAAACHLLHTLSCFSKLGIALALTIIITVASFGIFYSSGLNIMHMLTTASWSEIAVKTFAVMNATVNIVFGLSKNLDTLNRFTLGDALVFIPKTVTGIACLALALAEVSVCGIVNAISYTATLGKYTSIEVKPWISGAVIRGVYTGLDWFSNKINITLWRPTKLKLTQEIELNAAGNNSSLQEPSEDESRDTENRPQATAEPRASSGAGAAEQGSSDGGRLQRKHLSMCQHQKTVAKGTISTNTIGQVGLFSVKPRPLGRVCSFFNRPGVADVTNAASEAPYSFGPLVYAYELAVRAGVIRPTNCSI